MCLGDTWLPASAGCMVVRIVDRASLVLVIAHNVWHATWRDGAYQAPICSCCCWGYARCDMMWLSLLGTHLSLSWFTMSDMQYDRAYQAPTCHWCSQCVKCDMRQISPSPHLSLLLTHNAWHATWWDRSYQAPTCPCCCWGGASARRPCSGSSQSPGGSRPRTPAARFLC